ncbi:hypothetical protein ACDW82_09700 [Alcaligenes faecalis]|uniref:hypothetical protein n=1 Tax=Alcaligenes TaxID=507 RepID=UPI0005AAE903|nr:MULTISPECIES: hypothetical protein [Alcaligenes]ARP52612.1 hypothetical protein ALFP_0725 [Alcaligenes faecalis]ATH98648.1 hypothetical protein CPY64_02320 [Alcaligenes faecalis]AYZ91435.1 hypothetical protein EGY22_08090 [Alcaligenes faecalis]MBH0311750.1 hypothetical protein [Alcaligenes faecalis]MCX5594399.1 hypothetical protein [Alcaligenes faecalis]
MTTISLTDVTVSSDADSHAQGWLTVQFSNGYRIQAYCPKSNDNWAQGAQQLCKPGHYDGLAPTQVDKLLLQAADDGSYVVLQATLPKAAVPMTYARPADEHIYMELSHKQQSVFSADFLAIAAIIFGALYGLKWLFEKYLLPKL